MLEAVAATHVAVVGGAASEALDLGIVVEEAVVSKAAVMAAAELAAAELALRAASTTGMPGGGGGRGALPSGCAGLDLAWCSPSRGSAHGAGPSPAAEAVVTPS